MQAVIVDRDDPLTGEVRLRIQDAALALLAENELKSQARDPDHAGQPFVLAEEVHVLLWAREVTVPQSEVERALREDPCFYGRYRHGATLYFLRVH